MSFEVNSVGRVTRYAKGRWQTLSAGNDTDSGTFARVGLAQAISAPWTRSRAARSGAQGSSFTAATTLRLLVIVLLLFTVKIALGADNSADRDVLDATSAFGPQVRAVVYGLVFLTLCLVSIAIPDAPLLAYICSMPIAQFSGLRVALMLLQCLIVIVRTASPRCVVLSWPLSLFLLCIAGSSTWALNPHESFFAESVGVRAMLLQLPLAFAAAALLRSRLTTIRRLLWALIVGCIPGCILTIQNSLSGIRYMDDQSEYYMGFIRPDVFSPMLVMGGILLLFSLTSPGSKSAKRCFVGLLLLLFCVSILLTGIRSGCVAFGLAAFLLLLRTRSWVALAGVVVIAMLVGIVAFSTALNLGEKVASRWTAQSMVSGEARVYYWEVAASGFLKRPVLGIGWGCFPGFAADNTVGREAVTHNIFVRILCELGLVGFALFAAWIAGNALRLRRSSEGGLVGLIMIGVLVQGLFLDPFICSYFWLFVGICDGVRENGPVQDTACLEKCECALRNRINPIGI